MASLSSAFPTLDEMLKCKKLAYVLIGRLLHRNGKPGPPVYAVRRSDGGVRWRTWSSYVSKDETMVFAGMTEEAIMIAIDQRSRDLNVRRLFDCLTAIS